MKNLVLEHHFLVENYMKARGGEVIFTSLIGSQNYGLQSVNSDIDTYSVIFPNFEDYIIGTKPLSTEFEVEDGKCIVRDARLVFASLRKSNPNSLEIFATKYMAYNFKYNTILKTYLENDDIIKAMLHSNYTSMINAIAGTARMLHGRNMTLGKKCSHNFRLLEMANRYVDETFKPVEYLQMSENDTNFVKKIKLGIANISENTIENYIQIINEKLDNFANDFVLTEKMKTEQEKGNKLITEFLTELTRVYLRENV